MLLTRMNDSTWTWISGSSSCNQIGVYGEKGVASELNVPGSRRNAIGWYDSRREEFWVFGGFGYGNTSGSSCACVKLVLSKVLPLNSCAR